MTIIPTDSISISPDVVRLTKDVHNILDSEFWSKLHSLAAPTWPEDIEQLVNPHGDLRTQPPYVPLAKGLDNKIVMACAHRGIDPSDLDLIITTGKAGEKTECLVCNVLVSGSEPVVDRHLRTREHICNTVYNLWLDPTEILKGEEPYTCAHCYNIASYRIDRVQLHAKTYPENPNCEDTEDMKFEDTDRGLSSDADETGLSGPLSPISSPPSSAGSPPPTYSMRTRSCRVGAQKPTSRAQKPYSKVQKPVSKAQKPVSPALKPLMTKQPLDHSKKIVTPSVQVVDPSDPGVKRRTRPSSPVNANVKREYEPPIDAKAHLLKYSNSATREEVERLRAIDAMISSLKPGQKPTVVPKVLRVLHKAEERRLRELVNSDEEGEEGLDDEREDEDDDEDEGFKMEMDDALRYDEDEDAERETDNEYAEGDDGEILEVIAASSSYAQLKARLARIGTGKGKGRVDSAQVHYDEHPMRTSVPEAWHPGAQPQPPLPHFPYGRLSHLPQIQQQRPFAPDFSSMGQLQGQDQVFPDFNVPPYSDFNLPTLSAPNMNAQNAGAGAAWGLGNQGPTYGYPNPQTLQALNQYARAQQAAAAMGGPFSGNGNSDGLPSMASFMNSNGLPSSFNFPQPLNPSTFSNMSHPSTNIPTSNMHTHAPNTSNMRTNTNTANMNCDTDPNANMNTAQSRALLRQWQHRRLLQHQHQRQQRLAAGHEQYLRMMARLASSGSGFASSPLASGSNFTGNLNVLNMNNNSINNSNNGPQAQAQAEAGPSSGAGAGGGFF